MLDYVKWMRERVGHEKIFLLYVSVLVRDEQNRLLLQSRTDFELWGIPGGIVEIGETLEDTVRREMREETGLNVESQRMVGIYAGPQYDVIYPNGDQVQQVTIAVEANIVSGALHADGIESADLAWFSQSELPDNLFLWYQHMARDLWAENPSPTFEPPLAAKSGNWWMDLRQKIGQARIITIGIGAIVRNEKGQLLLGRRNDNNRYGMPAGLMELGETPSGTVVREAMEELGITLTPTRVLGAFTGSFYFHEYADGNQVQIASIIFEAQWTGGELAPDGVECLDADWFDADNLPPMDPRHKRLIVSCLESWNNAVIG